MAEFSSYGGVGNMGFISPMDTLDTYAVIDPLFGIVTGKQIGRAHV